MCPSFIQVWSNLQILATYNTALLERLGSGTTGPTRTERRDAIIQELNSTYSDADAVCLQEVKYLSRCKRNPQKRVPTWNTQINFYAACSDTWLRAHEVLQVLMCPGSNGPRQANLVLIAYASSEGSGESAHPRSLARTSAARSYKQ